MSLEFPQILDLDKLDVYHEENTNNPQFLIVKNLPNILTYGKHYFNISYQDIENSNFKLKQNSKVLFEFKDKNENIIFSDLTDKYDDVSGAAIGYVWIRKNPLRIAGEINDGIGYMTVVGELEGVPEQYQDAYNIRLTIPIEIRKEFVNRSPILFKNLDNLQNSSSFTETVEADSDSALDKIERSYFNISASHMDTHGGQVSFIELSYKESRARATEFTVLTTYQLTGSKTNFTSSDLSISSSLDGLNPSSHLYKFPTPTDIRRNGSVDFKLRFMNPNMEVAQNPSTGQDIEISGSITNFTGSKILVDTEDGIFITGSGGMIFGKDKTTGFRLDFKPEGTGVHKAEDTLEFTRISASVDKKPLVFSQKGSVLSDMETNSMSGSEKSAIIASSNSEVSHSFNSTLVGVSGSKLIKAPGSSIFGGIFNEIQTANTTLALQNPNYGTNFIFGGKNNKISSSKVLYANAVIGGSNNQIGQSTAAGLPVIAVNTIAGGDNNVISGGLYNFIGGGQFNEIGDESGGLTGCQYGAILGGTKNYINVAVSSTQDGPAIIGGRSNIVNHDGAVIIGMNGKTSTATNTVYVQNLDVAGNILGPITIDGNLTVNGEATYISSSTIVTSGSNIFGDDSSDTHIFNGKITASGDVDGGDYVIKIHNSNNDAGTDKGAGIEFAHNFVGSTTVKPAGKIIAGKDNNYAGADSNVDSNLQFFTALNGTDTERLKIDSNGLVYASGDISGSTIEGQTLTADVFLSAPSASITNLTNTNITSSGNISASGDLFVDDITCDDITLTNLIAAADSDVFVDINNSGFAFEANSGDQITFNLNNQNNVDFVVSGEADPQILYVDASTDRVGIGTATPTKKLQVTGDISASSFLASTFLSSPSASITNLTNTNITASGNISGSLTSTLEIGGHATIGAITASSYTGSFVGDGSGLTGVTSTVDIDGLGALGGTGLHQTQDNFMFSDNGTEKKITFSNLEDAIFGNVSGEITIAAGGAATIAANSIGNNELKQDDDVTLQSLTTTNNISGSTIEGQTLTADVFLSSPSASITNLTNTNITASGNISSSGPLSIFGQVVHLEGTDPRLKLKARGANHPGVEWHEDSTRKWVLYNDPDENDKLVFKNNSTELVKIKQDGGTEFTAITASGNITGSTIEGQTFTADVFLSAPSASITNLTNTNITSSGNISSSGTLITNGISSSGDLHLYGNKIYGDSDINTYIDFGGTNEINLHSVNREQINVAFSAITFNEAGNDVDVRMESNNNTNMFRLDGGRDKVGINHNPTDASATLQVEGDFKVTTNITASGNISSSGDLITSGFHVSSSGNVMVNSDNTGSMVTHKGAFSVNYGTHTQMTGSLTANGDGYGDIVKFGSTATDVGQLYYLNTSGTWTKTNATDNSNGADKLLAVSLGTNSNVDGMLLRGFVKISIAGTTVVGAPIYLRAGSGSVSFDIPTTSGNIVRIIGYNLTGGEEIYFNPDTTFVEVA